MKKTITVGIAVLALSLGSAAVAAANNSSVSETTIATAIEAGAVNQGGEQGQSGELAQIGQGGEQGQSGELAQIGQSGEQGQSGESNDAAIATPKK